MIPIYIICITYASISFIFSSIFLFTLLTNKGLRDKFSVFTVKFIIDDVSAILMILLSGLSMNRSDICGASLIIVTTIPLLQVLLLLSEVIDWSMAAFSPIYFNSSSLLSRFLPFIVSFIFSTVIIVSLIVVDTVNSTSLCIHEGNDSSVLAVFDISLITSFVCFIALLILLKRSLTSSYFKPVLFHSICTLVLDILALSLFISLKYSQSPSPLIVVLVSILTSLHSILHSIYFIYGHPEITDQLKRSMSRLISR